VSSSRAIVATGNSARSPRSSAAASSPMPTRQMPRAVAATSSRPSAQGAAPAVRGGGHPELRMRALVYTARGAVTCFVECGAHFLSLLELGLETGEPALVAILPGREAEHGAEGAQQAMRRSGGARAQRRQARGRVGAGVDQPAHRSDQRDTGIRGARRPGVAAAAGAEPRPLRCLGHREERHLRTTRLSARARRPAVDPRRPHGVHERAVVAAVAGQDGTPAAFGTQVGNHGATGHAGELSASPCRDLSGFDSQTWRAATPPTSRARLRKARKSTGPCRPPCAGRPRTGRGGARCPSACTTARPSCAGPPSAWAPRRTSPSC